MATRELMGWRKKERRWAKKYRGKFYFVSCRQMGCPPTKAESCQLANEWWLKKQAEIDKALGQAKRHPAKIADYYATTLENWRLYAKWHRKYGDRTETQRAEAMIEFLREALKSDNPPHPLSKLQEDPRWRIIRDLPLEEREEAYNIWFDRFMTVRIDERNEQAAPSENSVKAHADDYLALKKVQAQAKDKIGTYHSAKQWLSVFTSWIAPNLSVTDINEPLWEKFFVYLSDKVAKGEYSPATAKDYLGAARAFIINRWEKGFIKDRPRNLNSRDLVFTIPIRDPIVFSVEEVKRMLEAATGRCRLYILLALNCGMYPKDIATLGQAEVDWVSGRIVRKRTKTRDRSKNVPKVDYHLWTATFALLKEHRSNHPDIALLNEDGNSLWSEEDKDGKWMRNNNIKNSFFRLLVRMKLPKEDRKPLKSLRKTGATLLENSKYGRFSEHFLGEAPHSTASRHYSHKNGAEFDTAIKWLGRQFGM